MAYVKEILDAANTNIDSLKEHFGNQYFRNLMEAAYDVDKKFLLPEGTPPFKPSKLHEGQTTGQFWQIAKRLDVFYRSDVKSIVREHSFIGALEALSENEAKILIAIKEQSLDKLYTNLTLESLRKIGYFA